MTPPATTSANKGGSGLGLALGFTSHALAGLSPFIVAAVIPRTALLPGTALVYALGTTGLPALLVVSRVRHRLWQVTRHPHLAAVAHRIRERPGPGDWDADAPAAAADDVRR